MCRRENTISTSGRLFTRMREPCNGADRVRQRPGSSARNTPGNTPPDGYKTSGKPCAPVRPLSHTLFPAYWELRGCNFRASEREREREAPLSPSPLYLLLRLPPTSPRRSAVADPFVLRCNPSAALAPAYRSGLVVSCPTMETPSATKLKLRAR